MCFSIYRVRPVNPDNFEMPVSTPVMVVPDSARYHQKHTGLKKNLTYSMCQSDILNCGQSGLNDGKQIFSSVIFTHRPPLFAPLNFFLLQFLRFPVINIPFIGIRQKEFLNFIEKHGRYELLNVKNCFFLGGG